MKHRFPHAIRHRGLRLPDGVFPGQSGLVLQLARCCSYKSHQALRIGPPGPPRSIPLDCEEHASHGQCLHPVQMAVKGSLARGQPCLYRSKTCATGETAPGHLDVNVKQMASAVWRPVLSWYSLVARRFSSGETAPVNDQSEQGNNKAGNKPDKSCGQTAN